MNPRRFIGKRITLKTRDGDVLAGELVNIDKNKRRGWFGNVIMRLNDGLGIIRGEYIESIAPDDVEDKVQFIEVFGKPTLLLPPRLSEPLQKIADREGFTLEQLVNAILVVGTEEIKIKSKLWI